MHEVRFVDPAGSTRHGRWHGTSVSFGGREFPVDDVDVLPPSKPSKVVCVGRNYSDHIEEMGGEPPDRPSLFLKGPNAVAGHRDTITLPGGKERIDHEAELGAVIGTQCRNVPESDAMEAVAGFTCGNDLSNRDDQRREQNWVRGKAFDGSAPIGPTVTPPGEVPDDAAIRLTVNGEIRQSASRSDMIFSVAEIVAEITRLVTLEAGDVILTGTPEGVSPLADGDVVEVDIEGIPTLKNEVRIPGS